MGAANMLEKPSASTALVVGGGTMGADVALVLARAGCRTVVMESVEARRILLPDYFANGMRDLGYPNRVERLSVAASLNDIDWPKIDLVIECVPERLDIKQTQIGRAHV